MVWFCPGVIGPKDADRMAKRVDPDEVFKKQLSDLDLQCLPRHDCLIPLDHNGKLVKF